MMMKEHIVDTYGEVRFVMGNGCSGGSIQQNTVASIYPGLLDGIQPSCDYPDSITTGLEVTDCVLLVNFYASPDWLALRAASRRRRSTRRRRRSTATSTSAAASRGTTRSASTASRATTCRTLVIDQNTGAMAPVGAPRNNCLLPAALVYDPVTNPNGTRCGDADLVHRRVGHDRTASRRAACVRADGDNVGMQYGLKALLSGAISPEEFVTLNEKIGGFDADSQPHCRRAPSPTRRRCRSPTAPASSSSGANLGKLPIIDSRGYDEQGIHYIWRTLLRACAHRRPRTAITTTR